ncbi:hypothetical protein FB451DRAFT_1178192 [Mycena latifolia]|nr:hypothetical protein FB451DRAFT_1178192 [Mycena latifolia]
MLASRPLHLSADGRLGTKMPREKAVHHGAMNTGRPRRTHRRRTWTHYWWRTTRVLLTGPWGARRGSRLAPTAGNHGTSSRSLSPPCLFREALPKDDETGVYIGGKSTPYCWMDASVRCRSSHCWTFSRTTCFGCASAHDRSVTVALAAWDGRVEAEAGKPSDPVTGRPR